MYRVLANRLKDVRARCDLQDMLYCMYCMYCMGWLALSCSEVFFGLLVSVSECMLRMAACFCLLMEVDRINGKMVVIESKQLQKGYKASIRCQRLKREGCG